MNVFEADIAEMHNTSQTIMYNHYTTLGKLVLQFLSQAATRYTALEIKRT